MAKKLIKFFFGAFMAYLWGVFVHADFNIVNWPLSHRFLTAIAAFIAGMGFAQTNFKTDGENDDT